MNTFNICVLLLKKGREIRVNFNKWWEIHGLENSMLLRYQFCPNWSPSSTQFQLAIVRSWKTDLKIYVEI